MVSAVVEFFHVVYIMTMALFCLTITSMHLSTVTGGMLLVGKGIGQGVTQGDGKAFVTGISKGFTSLGTGVAQGLGTAGTGAADGVLSVGKGLFSGVKTVGKGIGGAFTGKQPSPRNKPRSPGHDR